MQEVLCVIEVHVDVVKYIAKVDFVYSHLSADQFAILGPESSWTC